MGSKNKMKKPRRKKQPEEREPYLFESDETFAFNEFAILLTGR